MPEGGKSDPVAVAADALAGYVAILEGLLAEPTAEGITPGMTSRGASSPEPWYTPAGHAMMTSWEGVPRLEAALRIEVTGRAGPRRGGSEGNWRAALAALPGLAAGLTPDAADIVARLLWRWIDEARAIHGIDELRQLRHLPKKKGDRLPPRCPNCLTYMLVADLDARVVFCTRYGCQDRNGMPPVASMTTSADGRPALAWADGLTEIAPDSDDYDSEEAG
jgi:hypothetical protein